MKEDIAHWNQEHRRVYVLDFSIDSKVKKLILYFLLVVEG